MRRTEHERFWSKVESGDNGCWIWSSAITQAGYGQFHYKSRTVYAHRFAYEQIYGGIQEGMDIDHLCRNTKCVNPRHLEAVTHKVNLQRGIGLTANNKRKTHCKRGHELNGKNIYESQLPWRICRICDLMRSKKFYVRVNDGGQAT